MTDKSHWGVPQLYALARYEVAKGIVECNHAAQEAGLGELDLKEKEK